MRCGRAGDRRRRRAARPACRGTWRSGPAWPSGAASSRRACRAGGSRPPGARPAWPGAPRRAARAVAVLGVGALVLGERALVEVQDPGDGLVEQLDVVADHEQGAAVGAQEAHQPASWRRCRGGWWARRGAARRCRRRGCGPARPGGARRRTARRAGRSTRSALRPEAGADAAHLGLGGVAAVGREALLGPGVAVRRCAPRGPPRWPGGASRGGGRPRRGRGPRGRGTAPVASTPSPVRAGVLGQVAEAALDVDDARGRLALAAEDLEQAGLARPVAADQADLVAGAHGEGGRLQREAAADLHGEVADGSTRP